MWVAGGRDRRAESGVSCGTLVVEEHYDDCGDNLDSLVDSHETHTFACPDELIKDLREEALLDDRDVALYNNVLCWAFPGLELGGTESSSSAVPIEAGAPALLDPLGIMKMV